MRIPSAVVDGDELHALLDQSTSGETGLPEGVASVALPEFFILGREIKDLARFTENQVIGLIFRLLQCGNLGDLGMVREGGRVLGKVGQVTPEPACIPLIGRMRGKRFVCLSGDERLIWDADPAQVGEEDRKHRRKSAE